MRKHSIVWGLVAAWILAGCGGTMEEGSNEVPGPEEPEEPVSEMHVPVETRDSFFLPFSYQGLTSDQLSVLATLIGGDVGRGVVRIRVARPRRTPKRLLVSVPPKRELNNLELNAPDKQFVGLGRSLGFSPLNSHPSPSGDVGPAHYVQAVNDSIAVFSKQGTTMTPIVRPTLAHRLWRGTPCAQSTLSDGTVRYDSSGERWIITYRAVVDGSTRMNDEPRYALGAVATASPVSQTSEPRAFHAKRASYYQCVAVSQTPDPTGFYHRYVATFDGFNDVPKFSVWPDAYYLTTTMSSSHVNGAPRRARVCAMERSQMLLGLSARMLCFNVAPHAKHYVDLLPADLDVEKTPMGPPPPGMPPMGSPLYLFSLRQTQPRVPNQSRTYDFFNRIGVWKVHVDWGTAPLANSSLNGPFELRVEPFQMGFQVPQLGPSAAPLDPLEYKLVGRAPYRNFGSHQAILLTHAVQKLERGLIVPGSGLRWYELRLPTAPLSSWPTIAQYGTYAPDARYRWLGSIAFDKQGNIALAYSASSSKELPSLRYTGQTTSCQTGATIGTMSAKERTLRTSEAAQRFARDESGLSRWGTSSSLNIDPVDGCTFWYTAEYRAKGGTAENDWSTQISAFRLPGCGTPARSCPALP